MQLNGTLTLAGNHRRTRLCDFSKIMILSCDPKTSTASMLLPQATASFTAERFVNRVEVWTSEQTRLLSGDNCQAVCFSQQFNVS